MGRCKCLDGKCNKFKHVWCWNSLIDMAQALTECRCCSGRKVPVHSEPGNSVLVRLHEMPSKLSKIPKPAEFMGASLTGYISSGQTTARLF